MLVRLEDGNLKDVKLTEVTPENYIVPEGEENTYHVMIEQKFFNPMTGERKSRPRLQKFNDKIWNNLMQQNLTLQGWTYTILYNPTQFLKEQELRKKEMKENARNAQLEAKARAEAKRQKEIDDRVAKAVAEALANVKQTSKGKTNVNKGNSKG